MLLRLVDQFTYIGSNILSTESDVNIRIENALTAINLRLVWFYGISTIVGYLMPNPLFTYILNMICKHILLITFLNDPELIFFTRMVSRISISHE